MGQTETKSTKTKVPMLDLKREYNHLKPEIDKAIARALEHQRWIMGPEVKELEKQVAEYVGTRHAIGVASGTDALVVALRALALKRTGKEHFLPDQQIITTPFTFTATGEAIIRAGATPVFVDIDPVTLNIAPETIAAAITSKTVGILPVHLYGQACDMARIMEIAREHGLFVVEDVAQAFGAHFNGGKCGSMGDAGAFSFFPSKNLGCFGDGGMVTTNDDQLAELAGQLRKHGGRDKYNVDHLGYNSRLDTLQAAVLLTKLRHLDDFNSRRKEIAARYNSGLGNLSNVTVPAVSGNTGHVFHQYTLRVADPRIPNPELRSPLRDALGSRLKERGIASMVYYPVPLHRMQVFQGRSKIVGALDETERAAAEVLSLPIEPLLTEEEIGLVIRSVAAAAAGN